MEKCIGTQDIESECWKNLNNWLAVQNLKIALKKAVFALGFKKPSVITL